MDFITVFQQTAAKYPERAALADNEGERTVSYAELDRLSSLAAGKLIAGGVKRNGFVAIYMERCIEYIIGYLGVLKAGCAVAPLAVEYPQERVDFILENCAAHTVITADFFADLEQYEPYCRPGQDKEPALLIYTSGSTGRPKGILHSAADLTRAALRQQKVFEGIEPLNYGASALISFVAHVFEFLTVFSLGGTSHILADHVRKSAVERAEYYTKYDIRASWIVPSMIDYFNKLGSHTPLEMIVTGSERVSRVSPEHIRILNGYGMSEVGGLAVFFWLDRMYENSPVGKPMSGVELLVLDESGKPVPQGEEGELCLKSCWDTVYFGDEERTARCMVKDDDGLVVFHSGDIGYIDENGNAVYVNRRDWMVKINGQRVETLEIEHLLCDMPGIENAVVKAFEDAGGQTYLTAYFVSPNNIPEHKLRQSLQAKLPPYMIPRFFVQLSEMPKNLNGKLDRKSLMPPSVERFKVAYEAPRNEKEALLCEAFTKVLACGRVGVNDDFFALGGDSIKVIKLLDAAGMADLTAEAVLTGKTPAAIAALCTAAQPTVAHGDIPAECPLSEAQRGVYLECVEEPDSTKYNIPFVCRLPEGTDAQNFICALKKVAAEHPALFVTVTAQGGTPLMRYRGGEAVVTEMTATSLTDACAAFVKPFDLTNGPLYRFVLCKHPGGLALLADVHHLVFDGTSVEVLVSQLAQACGGKEPEAEALTLFDVANAETHESEAYRAAQAYFKNKLEGMDHDSTLIPDVVTEEAPSAGREIVSSGEKFDVTAVTEFARLHGVTENTVFLGAFAYALAKFNGTGESAFCTVDNGRHEAGLASAVGMFVKTLPLYVCIDEKEAIADFLKQTQQDFFETMRHDCISFGELASLYGVSTKTVFIYQAELFGGAAMPGGALTVEMLETDDVQSDLDMMVMKSGSGYQLMIHYRKNLYTPGLIRDFARLYLNVVAGMLSCSLLGEIALTDETDAAFLARVNRTEVPYEDKKTVVEQFREQVQKFPDRICLVYNEKRFTYREVDALTDTVARNLVQKGVRPGTVVGILIPRCEYMLLCAMSVLKAGGTYLPLDPSYPPERLNLMMRDSGAALLFTTPAYRDVIDESFTGERILTDAILQMKPVDAILPVISPEDRFVLIYTSGSTGTPKGVIFRHANTMVTAAWVKRFFNMDENSRVTAYASYGFDANVFDMYPPLIAGGQLHIIADEIRLDFPALRDYYNENGITHTVMTTQVGRQFALMGGLKTLKYLSVGGERLTPFDPPANFIFYNLYGPTESTVVTTGFALDKKYKDIPIGKPVDNLKIYVADAAGKLLPAGGVGELIVAGPHVTGGYLNRPEKTAEVYDKNPYESVPGYERIYRTGDIVRLMHDGNLQFVGRRDGQVKVRGFRVELTEIEEVVRRFAGIKNATVAAFDDPAGGKFVAAYVVSNAPVDKTALCDFIRAEKPPYMVPAVVMQLDEIPLTQNHKVNKRALPVPQREVGEITPPANAVQQQIFDLAADAMGHRAFGIHTDLYEAGLTSIGALKLNVALAEAFQVPLRLADLKQNADITKLEAFLQTLTPQTQYEKQADYPLSETQKGIFVECMASPDTTVYNIPVKIRIGDGLDLAKLAEAVRTSVEAHPYLKTRLFTDADGNVRARRCDAPAPAVPVIENATVPANEALVRPFALIGEPLYRAAIYQTEQGNYLFCDFHHIISDGTSIRVFLQDVSASYAGKELQAEGFTGFEAALEEEKLRGGEGYAKAVEYWNTCLAGCDTSCLPKAEPESEQARAGFVSVEEAADVQGLKDYCRQNAVTLNAYFNTAFAFALSRFTGKESVTYATVYNGRNDSRLTRAVTMLVKTLPVVAELNFAEPTVQVIRRVQEQLNGSMSHDLCSFAELVHTHGVNADMLFVFQGDDFAFDSLCGEKAVPEDIVSDTAKAPLSVNVYLRGDSVRLTAEYRRDIFSLPFAQSFLDALLQTALALPDSEALKDISLLSAKAESIYAVLNASDTAIEPLTVPELIQRAAHANPAAKAVVAAGESLTYDELDKRANRLAHALQKQGLADNAIVGLILERGVDVPVTEYGIMKAGGAFLPMLPSYPDDRIDYCLQNADSPFVITTRAIAEERKALFAGKPYGVLTVEELLREEDDSDPAMRFDSAHPAYCIYTSGSTGKPKGVMIGHGSFTNSIQCNCKPLHYYRRTGMTGAALAASSFSFDMSLYEVYMPLCTGHCLVIATEDEFHDPLAMKRLIEENNIQMAVFTPSYINNFVSIPEAADAFARIRSLVVGAEAFPAALYDTLHALSPEMQIVNGYGPTEAAMCCSTKELHSGKGITIGRPTGNVKFFVQDAYGHILPPYGVGELIICGGNVGQGYVKLPDKTSASFFRLRGLPAYHSGDLVRVNGNGEVDFSGRIDNQVKLRGFRVELDEIEKVMCAYPSVKQAKVVVRNNGTEDYLAGFFTADAPVDTDGLTAHMKAGLTYYMVPAVLMQLEQMPLTANGKIDKKALPAVTQTANKRAGRRAPKKSLEQRLCEIFGSVLKRDEVFADDNFFELGGTSLTASKVTMRLMSENIEVKYGDIFDNPTPEELAEFILVRDAGQKAQKAAEQTGEQTRPALQYNKVRFAPEVTREPLGDVLLTGATGFLGIHVLNELLKAETGHIYCLVRRGQHESPEVRLKTMLIYYFGRGFEAEMRERVSVIEADITDASLEKTLQDIPFDTVINCAACVKHFSDNDILERINVQGVKNLIALCGHRQAKLIQISTVSVPGIHTPETYEKQVRMHEDELFVIDDMYNKYGISKYHAELAMLDAIEHGMRGKIIRVGNLMGRHSDGEFQANMETNMFLQGIRGFAVMGKYPISHMTDPMRFSPVDCTARAVVMLSGTNDRFTAFNCDNRYGFDEMKIIDACNRNGIVIVPEQDEIYYEEFRQKLGDAAVNRMLNGLAAYDIKDAHAVDTDNLFTTNILYRIGFSWPLVDDAYLDKAIHSIMTLDYFGTDGLEDDEKA